MYKRKDGRWAEVITINGKRKFYYGKTKADVLRKMKEDENTQRHGPKFKDAANEWDRWHEGEVSYRGHSVYKAPLKRILKDFGERRLSAISAQDVAKFLDILARFGLSKRTVSLYLSCVSQVYDYAILHGYIGDNPCKVVKLPKGLKTSQRAVPDEDNIKLIKENTDAPFGLFAFLLMCTGLRRGEALALRYDDIDRKRKTIRVNKAVSWEPNQPVIKEPKTSAGIRTVVLLDTLAEKLPHGSGYIFGGEKPLSQIAFRHAWEKYKKATGITITPHQLRHLYATILYEAGIDEKLAQELLGHSSITVTRDIYTHIRKSRLDHAAELLNKIKI